MVHPKTFYQVLQMSYGNINKSTAFTVLYCFMDRLTCLKFMFMAELKIYN